MTLLSFKRLFLILPFFLFPYTALGHVTETSRADVGLEEKLGQYITTDAIFADENGKSISLRDITDKPTIIAPVYLGCMHECPMLLSGLAQVLGKIELIRPGKDFQVITLSFNDKDTPAIARDKKVNYLKAIGSPFPEDAWKFLTGDAVNIKKFTDSIGFKFQRDSDHDFSHPLTLVVIGRDGKIIRYIEGTSFLPFEVTMALTEAEQGRVGFSPRKVLNYCFSYDPLKKTYVFNILKLTASFMVVFIASFFVYLMITGRKKHSDG